jgi:hypothetical protein
MTYQNKADTFNYTAFLDFLNEHNHNFFKLWTWELSNWDTYFIDGKNAKDYFIYPHPWLRSGSGMALDGENKFDLTKFNERYFERLRERVKSAGGHGCYVSIMLFEGWGIQYSPGAYQVHPFYPENNINELGLDTAYASRLEIHEMKNKKVLEIQEAYVKKVIETVNDLDNVLYEISNENHPLSTDWQYHMINFIKEYEKQLGVQHPVGMTFQYQGGTNRALFDSPADWISPHPEGGYMDEPPAADGSKVIINDTDHLWGLGENVSWVWKSFLQGMNPIFMDHYEGKVLRNPTPTDTFWDVAIRKNMGYTRRYADRVDLIHMLPLGNLSSSGYCLANPGSEYLMYIPTDTVAILNLSDASGQFKTEWFDPVSGTSQNGEGVSGGGMVQFYSPFHSGSSVLYLKAEK